MEGGCTKAKEIKKEKSMARKGDAPIWMVKEWRLRERNIKKKKDRRSKTDNEGEGEKRDGGQRSRAGVGGMDGEREAVTDRDL